MALEIADISLNLPFGIGGKQRDSKGARIVFTKTESGQFFEPGPEPIIYEEPPEEQLSEALMDP